MRQRTTVMAIALLLRCLLPYGGVVLVHEGMLREEYEERAAMIAAEGERRLQAADPQAAPAAVAARNALKDDIRDEGNPITEKLAEDRNLEKYGDPLGPSYAMLYGDLQAEGVAPEQIDAAIIASAGRSNAGVNAGALAALLLGAAVLLGYWAAVIFRVVRARAPRGRLVLREAASFVLAVVGGALGVALLAPLDLIAGASADTLALGALGMLVFSLPFVWLVNVRWPVADGQ